MTIAAPGECIAIKRKQDGRGFESIGWWDDIYCKEIGIYKFKITSANEYMDDAGDKFMDVKLLMIRKNHD